AQRDMARRVQQSGRTGWYYRVLQGGTSSSTGDWHGRARGSGSGQPDRGRTARTRAGSAIHASARRRAASGIAAADRADAAERHAER
ncbi:hypothetical protein ACQCQQ_18845, partial [Ralstonia pseudosolanacearum]